jgi:hypothetical protein
MVVVGTDQRVLHIREPHAHLILIREKPSPQRGAVKGSLEANWLRRNFGGTRELRGINYVCMRQLDSRVRVFWLLLFFLVLVVFCGTPLDFLLHPWRLWNGLDGFQPLLNTRSLCDLMWA